MKLELSTAQKLWELSLPPVHIMVFKNFQID